MNSKKNIWAITTLALLLCVFFVTAGSELTDQRWLLDNETAVTNYYINISDGMTPLFFISPIGNVNIKSAADQGYPLYVNGQFRASGNVYTDSGFLFVGADSVSSPGFTWNNDPNTGVYNIAPSGVGISVDATNMITITNTSVGITTTTPDSNTAFHVEGGDVRFNGTVDSSGFYYNSTSGNVGIGTTGPTSSPLVVYKSQDSYTALGTFYDDHATGLPQIVIGKAQSIVADTGLTVGYSNAGNYGFLNLLGDTQGTSLVIANGGNVGIGTTDPQDKLSVQGNIVLNDSIRGIKLNMDSSGQGNMSYIAFDEDASDGIVSGSDYFYLGRDGSNSFFDNLGTGDFALMINSVSKLAINGSTNHINLGYSVDTVNITGHIFNSSGMTSDQDIDLTGPNAQLNVIGASDSGIRLGSIGSNIKRMSADGHMQINSETTIVEIADDLNITTATNPRINFAGGGYIYDNGTAVIIGHE